jgi:hypothetical protein
MAGKDSGRLAEKQKVHFNMCKHNIKIELRLEK